MKRSIVIIAAMMVLFVAGLAFAESCDMYQYTLCIKNGGSQSMCEMLYCW